MIKKCLDQQNNMSSDDSKNALGSLGITNNNAHVKSS